MSSSSLSVCSADEEKSHSFEVEPGQVLGSGSTRYCTLELIGSGGFGQVAKAQNLNTGEVLALKIIGEENREAAQEEIKMLHTIRALDPAKSNILQLLEMFEHQGLTCLAFEMMDTCLEEFMVERDWEPLSVREIRPIAQQLLTAFDALKSIGVIHADLKLDNVMLVNHKTQPFRVKLIDFGLSVKTSEVEVGTVMSVAPFRAPEVFLGLPISEAVDIWALGSLLSMLYITNYLFGISSEYVTMKNIVDIIGQPADHLLAAGFFSGDFFVQNKYLDQHKWWLKTPDQYQQETGIEPGPSYKLVNSLDDLITLFPVTQGSIEIDDRRAFVSLLEGLLNTDPKERITPKQALRHPFISMVHLEENAGSQYVDDAKNKMVITHMYSSEESMIKEEDHSSPAAVEKAEEQEAAAAPSISAEDVPVIIHMDLSEETVIKGKSSPSPVTVDAQQEKTGEAQEVEAAPSSSADSNPAVIHMHPGLDDEDVRLDIASSPVEVSPPKVKMGRLRRIRQFFTRVFRAMRKRN